MRKGRARGGPGLRDDRQRLAVVLEQAGALGGGHQRENPAGPAHVLPACCGLGDGCLRRNGGGGVHVCDVRMRVWVYVGDGGQGLTEGEGGLTCNSTQLWRDQRLRADANGAGERAGLAARCACSSVLLCGAYGYLHEGAGARARGRAGTGVRTSLGSSKRARARAHKPRGRGRTRTVCRLPP